MIFLRLLSVFLVLIFLISCTSVVKKDNRIKEGQINIIAHRGGAKLAPENTLAAFKNALSLGVDMIEIDVILSKDGEVIVIHDDSIDRTTDGKGIVKDMTLQEIKKYDAGNWFDEKYKGEKIPTLDEVFNAIDGKATLLIEIKDGDEEYPGLEKKVVEHIHKHKAVNWTIVQSFNENSVLRVREMDKKIVTYFLLGRNFIDYFTLEVNEFASGKNFNKKYDGLAPHYSVLNEGNIAQIKKMNYKLFAWTVNDSTDMEKFIKLGVDGIITDSPDKLAEILYKENQQAGDQK